MSSLAMMMQMQTVATIYPTELLATSMEISAPQNTQLKRLRSVKSKMSAVAGLAAGTLIMTVFGSAFNALYLIPKFAELFGMPIEAIVGAGNAINSHITGVSSFVLLAVAPMNLIKGAVVSVLTLLLYKKIETPLFGKE